MWTMKHVCHENLRSEDKVIKEYQRKSETKLQFLLKSCI